MTIAICLKVGDGVVFGADSAVTIPGQSGYPDNVYFNAEKITNLVKGLPIGSAVYGLGGFGGRSATSCGKDLRRRLAGQEEAHRDWALNPASYTMEEVARRFREFYIDELYETDYAGVEAKDRPPFGAIVAGFSAGATSAEIWTLEVAGGQVSGPVKQFGEETPTAIIWQGMSEPMYRLVRGWSSQLANKLVAEGMKPEEAVAALDCQAPLFHPAMPVQDAVDLVDFLVDVACKYYRFMPEPPSVAPPIDLAAITRHEGFKWVRRKHYYRPELNP